jgi:replicative DNA helicase
MKRTDPRKLAEALGVDFDNPQATNAKASTNGQAKNKASGQNGSGRRAETEEFKLDNYPAVKDAVYKNSADRSTNTFYVMAACYRASLTFPQACWAVYQSDRLTGRLQERKEDDEIELMRVWHRVIDDEQRQRQKAEQADTGEGNDGAERIVDGATFILSAPETIPAVWGRNDEVLWAEGESLMIAGTLGLGKTTLAGQLVRALLFGGEVLGFPVAPVGEPILYLAMDRPRQIARSMRRQFGPKHERWLSERLKVWQGPPQEDMAKDPELLRELARQAGARHVFVDSLKDAAIKLSDDEVGAAYNRARQLLIADGCQLCELHHLVKRASGDSVDDIYGSRWLTAGAGSLILLSGEPGDPIIKFKHVRAPAAEVGPFQLLSVQDTGEVSIYSSADLIQLAEAAAESGGLTAKNAAVAMFEKDKPTRAEIEKARRKLDKLTADGKLRQEEGHRGGQVGEGEARWLPA